MPSWPWFYLAAGLVVIIALVFSIQTARLIRSQLGDRWQNGPIDPSDALGMSRRELYANAVLSQALMLALIWIGMVVSGVDMATLGLPGAVDLEIALVLGVAIGFVLAGLNEVMERSFRWLKVPYDDALRRLLAPSTPGDWASLGLLVLPTVAIFEELLFRGVLIGGLEAGLGVSPWVLGLVSSVLFAIGHVLQGLGGLVAAFLLGLFLAGTFILTESLLVVIIAHYLVNLIEFVRHPPGRSDPL